MNDMLEELLTFAEAMLGRPLHHWQRDMLMSMLGGYKYVPGRSNGKTETLNIFQKWNERPNKTPDAIYTYDMLMEGIDINTKPLLIKEQFDLCETAMDICDELADF